MTEEDWQHGHNARSVAFLLGGDSIATPDERGERIVGDTLLVLLNAWHEPVTYMLPDVDWGEEWEILVDTAGGDATRSATSSPRAGRSRLEARSLASCRRPEALRGARHRASRRARRSSMIRAAWTPTPPNILVVDDEKNIRRTLRMVLEREGYAVAEAESAEEALELLEARAGRPRRSSTSSCPAWTGSRCSPRRASCGATCRSS